MASAERAGAAITLAALLVTGAAQAQAPQTPAPLVLDADRRQFCASLATVERAAVEDFAPFGVVERSGYPGGRIAIQPVFRETAREYVRQDLLRSGRIVSSYNAEFRDMTPLHDRLISVVRECHPGVTPVARDTWTTWDVGERVSVAVGAARSSRPMIVLSVYRSHR